MDVWLSRRTNVGQQKVCRVLFHLCTGRRFDPVAGSVPQWQCLPNHWRLWCGFWTTAGIRCNVAKQQTDPDFFPSTHQSEMVCTDLWCCRINFRCYRRNAPGGSLCTSWWPLFRCRIIMAMGLAPGYDLEVTPY